LVEPAEFGRVGNRYKILSTDNGASYSVYDLRHDVGEAHDPAGSIPAMLQSVILCSGKRSLA
jgi:hypothetical protein